jgi:hypothetical protein
MLAAYFRHSRQSQMEYNCALIKAGWRIRIHLIRIQIQHFRLNTDPDPGALMTKNRKQFIAEKFVLNFFVIKNYNLPIPRPPKKDVQVTKKAFRSQKRTSSTSKHEISEIFSTFVGHFCPPGWIRIPNTDPDPLTRLNPDPIGIRIRNHG